MPADVNLPDEVLVLKHCLQLRVKFYTHCLFISDSLLRCYLSAQVLLNKGGEGLNRGRNDLPFFVIQQLLHLWVEVLPRLAWTHILGDEGELSTDLFTHFPVEVLADVLDSAEHAIVESVDGEERVLIGHRTYQQGARSSNSECLCSL